MNEHIIEDKEKNQQIAEEKVNKIMDSVEVAKQSQESLFKQLFANIEQINPELGGFEEIASMLALPDEQFDLIAPLFLEEFEMNFHNRKCISFLKLFLFLKPINFFLTFP